MNVDQKPATGEDEQNCIQKYKNMIPEVRTCFAWFLFACNLVIAGSGTLIMACINRDFWKENLIIGLLQFILMFIFIGWLWSVIWGVFVVLRRKTDEEVEVEHQQTPNPVPSNI